MYLRAITLRSGLEPKSTLSRMTAAVKLHARAITAPRLTRGWLELLNSHPALRELASAQPRLIHKIYRPWLSKRLCRRRRLAALGDHYRFIVQQGLGDAVVKAARDGLQLASFTGKSGAHYTIELRAVVPMEREGELVLQLMCQGSLVYSLAFSFVQEGDLRQVGIGCVQGPQCGAGLDLAREATRDLHGLRPKNLLVRLASQLGHARGCHHLVLVGNLNRTVCGKSLRKGKVKADYDSLWQELGADQRADGDWQMACAPLQEPDLEEVPSKKRAEVRRRHELMTQINYEVLRSLSR
ncbi:DUF535 family protein [Pseudoduganella violaceinigra]|uniref:DUF535 family protein n=1 Tax=Pseudoduganella violaceinigra TaxID=246602 RepID=UPI0004052672|nr:DUF535 family protein [Pseudoduganella violaceinigra]